VGFLFLGRFFNGETSQMAEATTETKAQRIERFKREKNAWQAFDEIKAFAKNGRASISPEWTATYLRAWGIYTQGDGIGVIGGKNGEGKATDYFMVRIRIPNGLLTSHQTRAIADITQDHARGIADITVRQNFQLHWVTVESLPDVIEALQAAGLTTVGACGDVARNITGCPLAGFDAHEFCDASPLALEINRDLGGNADFWNLPRKFKIGVTGCRSWCNYPEINDIGFTPVTRRRAAGLETGFSVRVGGGLSTNPHLAVRLNAFVPWKQVAPVARGIAEIFKAADVLRESRDRARLKFLFLQHGWTAEGFLTDLEQRLGFKLDQAEPEDVPSDVHRDHVGIHAQKQLGFSYVGANVLSGRITPDQLRLAADLSDRYGDGHIRNTVMQNLVIVNIPDRHAVRVAGELTAAGLPVQAAAFARAAVACTGTEFCKLALTETKGFARWLATELDDRIPGFQEQLRINVTGCPNSCGQHWIADIGLEGKKIKHEGKMVDAYYFCIGGSVGEFASIGRPVGYRCAATDVPDAIERLMNQFNADHKSGENLRAFFARHSNDDLRSILAGGLIAPVQRDAAAAGAVPMGVEG
jgi:sulfite reductase (ferredoxin)